MARAAPELELTAIPATIGPPAPKVTLEPIIAVQVTPSGDVNVVYVLPYRVISKYAGAAPAAVVTRSVRRPDEVRLTTSIPFVGVKKAP